MRVSILATFLVICLVTFAANVNSKSIDLGPIKVIFNDSNVFDESRETSKESLSTSPESSGENPVNSSPDATGDITSAALEDTSSAHPAESSFAAPVESTSAAPEAYSSDFPNLSTSDPEDPTTVAPENTIASEESTPALPEHTSSLAAEHSAESSESSEESSEEVPDHDPNKINVEQLDKFVEGLFKTLGELVVLLIDDVSKNHPIASSKGKDPNHQNQIAPYKPPNLQNTTELAPKPRIFGNLWWLLKSILKTLRGINCTIKAVVNVKETSIQMIKNFEDCGVETRKQIQAVLDSAQKVISIANDIININANVCENPDYLSNDDSSQKTSSKCVKQLRSRVLQLNRQIKTTTKLIKKVPADAGECVTATFLTYQQSIISFPNFIKDCAKL